MSDRSARPPGAAARPAPPRASAQAITVAGLAASGGALLRGVQLPDPGAPIASVEIYDAARGHDLPPGALLLAVGVDPAGERAARLCADAAAQGVAAVALAGTADEALAAADGADVAVFAVTPGASWAHVHTVARALTTTAPAARELASPYQDLFAVANAVAASVGGPATIEDAESRLLAFSSPQEHVDERRRETILGRATPGEYTRELRRSGVFRRLAAGAEPVLLPADPGAGLRARLGTAVKAGDELLGYLWVSEGERPLGERAAQALRDLAPVVAVQMLRVLAAGSAERNRRRDLATAALDGGWTAEHAAELELRRGERLVVACLSPDDADLPDAAGYAVERACQVLEVHLATYRIRGLLTRRGDAVHCILPSGAREGSAPARALVGELLDRLAVSMRMSFRAGVGEAVAARALRAGRADAELALRTGRLLALPARAVHVEDVRDRAVLVALRDAPGLQPLLERGSVARIAAHDAAHGTAYAAALRAYLDCGSNVPAAARALDLHVNTLRYRLRKATEIFVVDLDDPHERLALSLQLWLLGAAAAQEGRT